MWNLIWRKRIQKMNNRNNNYVIIDIDDVLAATVPEWLKRYNRKYKDSLKMSYVRDWNISKYTVPECGDKIYDLLESKTFYNKVKPLPNALEGVGKLRELGFPIVTGGKPEYSTYKFKWLQKHNFWNQNDHYVQTSSKHLIKGVLMIDDNYDNICNTSAFGLLMDAPWNSKFEFKNRVMGWHEIIQNIDEYKENFL